MNTFEFVTIEVTNQGEGLNGAVRQLNAAGYYAAIVGSVILYGPQREHLRNRMSYTALIGDTLHVSDRSDELAQQHNQQQR